MCVAVTNSLTLGRGEGGVGVGLQRWTNGQHSRLGLRLTEPRKLTFIPCTGTRMLVCICSPASNHCSLAASSYCSLESGTAQFCNACSHRRQPIVCSNVVWKSLGATCTHRRVVGDMVDDMDMKRKKSMALVTGRTDTDLDLPAPGRSIHAQRSSSSRVEPSYTRTHC